MPSLKLSNPFRRGADRPSLKQRAASLKATAARVMKRRPADPFEGTTCPDGFVPYPFENPVSYASIGGIVIPNEVQKLLDLALAEHERVCSSCPDFMGQEQREGIRQASWAHLRLDTLIAAVTSRGKDAQPAQINAEADALLLHFGRQFEAARLAEEAADRAFGEADERAETACPAKPGSLVFRASDHDYVLRQRHMHPDAWEGLEVCHDDIEWMRKRTFTHEVWREAREGERAWHGHGGKLPEIQPYPEAEARAAELVGIWDAWQAERDRAEAECGVPAALAASEAAFQVTKAIAAQIAATPAHTVEGLKVKIRALDFFAYSSGKDEPDAILMRSLVQDATVLASASATDEPVTLEGAASLSFDAYAFDAPALSHTGWGDKLNDQIWGLLLMDRLLRMGKAEMETFIREAGERNDETPGAMYRALDAAQVTLEGWGKLLDAARCRYTVAASSAVLNASRPAEG